MTDYPEAVREYEDGTAHLVNDERYDRGPHKVKRLADAAIAELKAELERKQSELEEFDQWLCDFTDGVVIPFHNIVEAPRERAEKAEAEVLNLTEALARMDVRAVKDEAEHDE